MICIFICVYTVYIFFSLFPMTNFEAAPTHVVCVRRFWLALPVTWSWRKVLGQVRLTSGLGSGGTARPQGYSSLSLNALYCLRDSVVM